MSALEQEQTANAKLMRESVMGKCLITLVSVLALGLYGCK